MCFCRCCIIFLKGAYTLFLLYYFFATLIFNGKQAKVKVVFRKTNGSVIAKSFAKVSFWYDISSKLIRWNAWDQFQTVKLKFAGSRSFTCYWGICFSLKLPIKENTQLVSHSLVLDIRQWILIVLQGYVLWVQVSMVF